MSLPRRSLSILSLSVLCALAIFPLFFDLRTDGRINVWGIRALVLIVASFVVGVVLEVLGHREDTRKERADAENQALQVAAIASVGAHARGAAAPLRPLKLFMTLRYRCTPDVLDPIVAAIPEYQRASDLLSLEGVVTQGIPGGYNDISEPGTRQHCELDEAALAPVISRAPGMGEYILKMIVQCQIRIFFSDQRNNKEPDLLFDATLSPKPSHVKRLIVFDDVVYADSFLRTWTTSGDFQTNHGVADLATARITFELRFLTFQDPRFDIEHTSIHNLHFYFGEPSPLVLSLTPEQLRSVSVKPDPQPLMKADFFTAMLVSASWELTPAEYRSQIREVSL